MSHDFHVGQKIVCIDAEFNNVAMDQVIREGEIYTIRTLGMFAHYIDGEFLGVRLMEINRGADPAGYCEPDPPFAARRFRPLVHDPLASLRNLAADPEGYVPNAPEEQRRKKVREEEKV